VLVAPEVQVERNRRMECLHNQPKGETVLQAELPRHNYLHHQTILIQTEQVQIILHHPGTGVVEGLVEEEEEVEDLAAAAEEVVAEEGNAIKLIIHYLIKKEAVRIKFSHSLFLKLSCYLFNWHIRSAHVSDTNVFSISFFK
jgi:hypothetical protein